VPYSFVFLCPEWAETHLRAASTSKKFLGSQSLAMRRGETRREESKEGRGREGREGEVDGRVRGKLIHCCKGGG
jgi:hypothetical protein